MASEEDLAILLDNLIENALRYSPTRRHGRLGPRRRGGLARGPRRRAGARTRRGDEPVRPLRPRQRGQLAARYRPRARDRPDAGPPLARQRLAGQPDRGRHARRGALSGRGYSGRGVMGRSLVVAVLALVGLLCAAGMGYAAYVVSRDSVAVPVTKLQRAVPKELTPARVSRACERRSRPVEHDDDTVTHRRRRPSTTRRPWAAQGNSGHGERRPRRRRLELLFELRERGPARVRLGLAVRRAARRSGSCRRPGRGRRSRACRGSCPAARARSRRAPRPRGRACRRRGRSCAAPRRRRGSTAWYSRAETGTSSTASSRQRKHGPCSRASKRSSKTVPVEARVIGELGRHGARHRQVALAAELERLELDLLARRGTGRRSGASACGGRAWSLDHGSNL